MEDLDTFTARARAWLDTNAQLKQTEAAPEGLQWGQGEFSVAVFHDLSFDEEQQVLNECSAWTQRKAAEGYHRVDWEPEYGGLGLTADHARAFANLERLYDTPAAHETHNVTAFLMAPTIRLLGSDWQKENWVQKWSSVSELCCQLFSEPAAGSDLANVATRAERDGDEWVLNGQKVWSSGAQFSEWGMAVCRTDLDAPKHKGITVFAVPLQDHPGVEVRQIRQMSGGTTFNEVFLTDARIPDRYRVGEVGEGWGVALTILGFERETSGSGPGNHGGSWTQFKALCDHLGAGNDPVLRDEMAKIYIRYRVMTLNITRSAANAKAGRPPGPDGSIGKLFWTDSMRLMTNAVSKVLGARLLADTGEWGTYEWAEHVLGAPGYRIDGGSDEIQRNIIGERVLGLPGEPRVDKGVPYRDVPQTTTTRS